MIATILTPWVATGDTNERRGANVPQVALDYAIDFYRDATDDGTTNNVVPVPNIVATEIHCSADVLAAIDADTRYTVLVSE